MLGEALLFWDTQGIKLMDLPQVFDKNGYFLAQLQARFGVYKRQVLNRLCCG